MDKDLRTEQDVVTSLEQELEQTHSAQEQARRALLDLEKKAAARAAVGDTERKALRTKLEVRLGQGKRWGLWQDPTTPKRSHGRR